MLRIVHASLIMFCLPLMSLTAVASKIVSDETIAKQLALTEHFKLSNGVNVYYRQIPNSDILQLNFAYDYGYADQSPDEKAIFTIMSATMSQSAGGWSKNRLFKLQETYSATINCSNGIELSYCSLTTINDYWDQILPAFTAIIKKPSFMEEDIKLAMAANTAEVLDKTQNPETYSNEVVNKVFYGENHPYYITTEKYLRQLKGLKRPQLVALHQKINNAYLNSIVIVGSLPTARLKKDLEKSFGDIPSKKIETKTAEPPAFVSNMVAFEHREIPTSYIKIKYNIPGILDADNLKARLMLSILSQELESELRTKHSLSYAAYAFGISYQVGIGVISVSTSKPKEAFEAIVRVIRSLKQRSFSNREIEEYKMEFATSYFLTLEGHDSLAGALTNAIHYFKDPGQLYNLPKKLESITAKDVEKMIKTYLNNFRIGVVYDKEKFKGKWAKELNKATKSK